MRKRTGQGQRFLHAIDILLVTLVLAGVLAILGISVPTCAGDAQRLAASEDAAAPTPPPASEKIGAYDPTLPWQTREGELFCANYFAIKDARAALEAQDQKWFQSTGCLIADAGRRVVLIDAPNVAGNVIWKGRVLDPVTKDGVDTYFSEYDVVTFVRGGLFPTQDKAEREFKELVAINNQGRPRVYAVLPQHLLSREGNNLRLVIGPFHYRAAESFFQSIHHDSDVRKQAKVMQRDNAEREAEYKAAMDEILAGRGAPNDPRMLELMAREKRRMAATSKELSTMTTGQPCQVIGVLPRG